jgi:hypothetical protein
MILNEIFKERLLSVLDEKGHLIDYEFMIIGIRHKAEASDLLNETLLFLIDGEIHKGKDYRLNTKPIKEVNLVEGQYTYIKAQTGLGLYYGQQRLPVELNKEGFLHSDQFDRKLEGVNLLFTPFHHVPGLRTSSVLSGQSKASQYVSASAYSVFKRYAKEAFYYSLINFKDIM